MSTNLPSTTPFTSTPPSQPTIPTNSTVLHRTHSDPSYSTTSLPIHSIPISPVLSPTKVNHHQRHHSNTTNLVSLARRATGRFTSSSSSSYPNHSPLPPIVPTSVIVYTKPPPPPPPLTNDNTTIGSDNVIIIDSTSSHVPPSVDPGVPLLVNNIPFNAARVGKVLRDKTHLFLSTKRTQYRKRIDTIKSSRFLLRVSQLFASLVAVVSLYVATFNVNYTSASIGVSGINLASLTCVTSTVLCITYIFNFLFPNIVGIPPSEEATYSPVELVLDMIYCGLWVLSASVQAANGSCPRYLFRIGETAESHLYSRLTPDEQKKLINVDCLPWNLSWAFGFANGIMFLWSASRGLYAWRKERAARQLLFL